MSRVPKITSLAFALVLVFISICVATGTVFAKSGSGAISEGHNTGGNGADSYVGTSTTGSTGNSASRSSYTGVFASWDTGIHVETVTSPNQAFSTPEIRYGSTVIPAMTVTAGNDMPVGSEINIVAVYAENPGYVYKDGERKYVNAGELLAYLPAGGLTREDGSRSTSWDLWHSSGKFGDIPISEGLAYLNQLVDAGQLDKFLQDNPQLTAWGGKKALEKMSKEEIKKLICEGGCCTDDCDDVHHSSCHSGSHAGWTSGAVKVNNYTKGTGWTNSVWARPGDTVRFDLYYCWGVGAVGGDADNNPKEPWAIYPDGNATVYGSAVNEVWFQISGSPNNNYLFGYDEQYIVRSGKHVLTNPHEKDIGAADPTLAAINDDSRLHDNYEFEYLSPSDRSEDANGYNCKVFDFSTFTINDSHGYQIPGLGTGGCNATSKTRMNDAGGSFSQTITYSYDTAWQRYRHTESGSCKGTCTWQKANPKEGENGVEKYEDKDMNTLIEYNTNTLATPYESLAAARGSGANNWGLIKKWSDDTDEHGTEELGDCDYDECSANNWQSKYYKSDCPCAEANKCNWCSQEEADGSCKSGHMNYNDANEEQCGCKERQSECWKSYSSSQKEHKHDYPGKSHHKPDKDYTTGQQQLGSKSSTATVNVPYSYRTSLTSTIQEGDVIYTGETVYSMFTASIVPRIVSEVRSNEAYATVVPGYIQAVEFVVDKDSTLSKSKGTSNNGGSGPCDYYRSLGMISGCNTIWEEHGSGGYLNEEGRYGGKTYTSNSIARVVPDVYSIGSKYCVAVGISTSDSHSRPDTQTVSGMSNPSGWRISNLSCRTIAKKPNFEVWNGNFYTKGGVNTSVTIKRVGANLGDPVDATGYFGSWEEYLLSAKGTVTGFSSGAGFGYYGGYNSNSLGLQGGTSPGTSYCNLSRLTIANDKCSVSTSEYYSNRYATGNSMVEDSAATVLERIRSRYLSSKKGIYPLDNGAAYIYPSKANIKTSELYTIARDDELQNTELGPSVIRQTKSFSSESHQTTSNYASNTLVIHVTGTLTIDTDICTGSGDCGSSANLRLGYRNNEYYTNIYSVPQILIIADGGIVIRDNVTQIDAWLITNGNINTCNGLAPGSKNFSASTCGNQLIINGPIFANSLTPVRNAGADPGAGKGNNANDHNGNPIYYNLSNDGSTQPAEIFNLRPDVLFWAYSQAQRYSQANVTYTRELAPRY